MATLQERVTAWRKADEFSERMDRLEGALTMAVNAVADQGFTSPDELIEQLREYDPQYVDMLVGDLLWDNIGQAGSRVASDKDRQRAVDTSRSAFLSNPIAQHAVWTWTAHGLGDGVQVVTDDESAQEDWDEFIESDRNASVFGADRLHALSERVLVDGNVFLSIFAAREDGLATVRPVSQDEITVLCNPADAAIPWFYKREFTANQQGKTLYYPDWALYLQGEEKVSEAWEKLVQQSTVSQHDLTARADQQNNGDDRLLARSGTAVCMMHIAHNRKAFDSLWGWPLTTVAGPWLRAHKRHLQARLTLVLNLAQFARRTQVDGGSRAVSSVLSTIASNLSQSNYTETNPPAALGAGWHVENRASDTAEIEPRTGGADAKANNDIFSWMTGMAVGENTVTMGLDTARYATAVQMDKVQSFLFSRYRTFWSTQFRRMVRIVLTFQETYGGKSYKTQEAQVNIDSFSLPDFPDIVNAQSQLWQQLTNAVNAGILSADGAAAIQAAMAGTALQALGVQNVAELTSDEALIPEEQEEPEQPPVIPEMPEEPEAVETALRMAARNFADDLIDADQLVEVVIADVVERRNGG